jgi:hypothetical protein
MVERPITGHSRPGTALDRHEKETIARLNSKINKYEMDIVELV